MFLQAPSEIYLGRGLLTCLRLVLTDLSRVQRITKVLSAVPKIFGGKLLTAHFFVDILAIFCTVMQISLHIRHLAPELCPMHFENAVSARPEQTCIFHRPTRCLCSPVSCIYNMPNKTKQRRLFCKYFFSYDVFLLRDFFCILSIDYFNFKTRKELYYEKRY